MTVRYLLRAVPGQSRLQPFRGQSVLVPSRVKSVLAPLRGTSILARFRGQSVLARFRGSSVMCATGEVLRAPLVSLAATAGATLAHRTRRRSRAVAMISRDRLPFVLLAAGGLAVACAALLAGRRRRWDLRDRVVLVTGGSRGLGLLIARELVREGARVAICARDEATLARARTDLEDRGGRVLAVRCDVGVRTDVDRMVQQVTERLGPIDALINNAGTIAVGPIETMGIEDFHHAMDINFWGAVHAIMAVLPGMRRRGRGRVVNVASIGGKISVPHLVPYSASKFALVGLSEGLRAELAQDNIQVTTVCPGLMRTGSPRHALFKGRHREEYAWFSVSDSLPVVSMSADRAARQIVSALRAGSAERILSLPAKMGARFNGLFPASTTALLAVANRYLPAADGGITGAAKGKDSESPAAPSVLTRLGDRAAERNNQV